MNACRRPPWLPFERDQIVLYALAVLLLVAVAVRYGVGRWATAKDVRKLETGDRIDYRVDLNRAGPDELDLLPGIGPVKAERIVAHREAHGLFRSVEELAEVRGISRAAVGQIRELVTVGPAAEGREPPE